ncbi:hypothetical protein [Streptomyces sp. NPDC056387]|uniref:hypothetical protein n=1 Tax=Streptomyces sp. NPDC056387 TaxID=3345803 RepID=UPI0035D8EC0B
MDLAPLVETELAQREVAQTEPAGAATGADAVAGPGRETRTGPATGPGRQGRTGAGAGPGPVVVRRLVPATTPGDRALLGHLVRNLLVNAVRHRRPGGRIAVAPPPAGC